MKITLADSVLNRYPEVNIGYLIADIKVEFNHPYVEDLKSQLKSYLEAKEITITNFANHPDISKWQKIYRNDFGVKPSQFRSSVEALIRRVLKGQGIWNISSVVDLYNCCSVMNMLPMGAYDLGKIQGDIYLRYGRAGEVFLPLGSQETISVEETQVIYADDEKVICWLWNHRDSQKSCVTGDTKQAIFFVDAAFLPTNCSVHQAVKSLAEHLRQIGCTEKVSGVLDANYPVVNLSTTLLTGT